MYASLKDVAARAGVSFQTTSKVLNGDHSVVATGTLERILAAADEVGYVPNALARGLVRQASSTIGVLVDDVADPALSQLVRAAERAAAAQRHAAFIGAAGHGGDPTPAIRTMQEHRVGGILVVAPSLESDPRLGAALRGRLPAVSVNHVHGGGLPVVTSDHSTTGELAAQHLVGLGHREIATVTGPRARRVVRSRHQAFRNCLREAGAPLPARCVAEADWTPAGAYAAAERLLNAGPSVGAIFVHSDVMTLGVLRALRDRGIRVPDDCSVVSCDDVYLAPFASPPLTTIHVPFEQTGERAVGLLLQRMRGETIPEHEFLPTHLVVRSSTAAPAREPPRSNAGRSGRSLAAASAHRHTSSYTSKERQS